MSTESGRENHTNDTLALITQEECEWGIGLIKTIYIVFPRCIEVY